MGCWQRPAFSSPRHSSCFSKSVKKGNKLMGWIRQIYIVIMIRYDVEKFHLAYGRHGWNILDRVEMVLK
jgi:hypothetical protein